MTANGNGPGAGHTGPLEKHTQNAANFNEFALRRLGDQLTAFNRLEESASRYGINVYPLDGDSIYMTGSGGFHCCAPDIRAAAGVIRQFGAAHG